MFGMQAIVEPGLLRFRSARAYEDARVGVLQLRGMDAGVEERLHAPLYQHPAHGVDGVVLAVVDAEEARVELRHVVYFSGALGDFRVRGFPASVVAGDHVYFVKEVVLVFEHVVRVRKSSGHSLKIKKKIETNDVIAQLSAFFVTRFFCTCDDDFIPRFWRSDDLSCPDGPASGLRYLERLRGVGGVHG